MEVQPARVGPADAGSCSSGEPPDAIELRASPGVRISVSKIAAIVGLHPFADAAALLELFESALYQDAALLAEDTAAIGVTLMSAEAEAMEHVAAFTKSHLPAVRDIGHRIQGVLMERKNTNGVQGVRTLGQQTSRLVEQARACGAIDERSARRLEGTLTSSLYTSFGTRHENDAIAQYEKQTGNQVREANEHLLLWSFPHARDEPPSAVRRVPLRARQERAPSSLLSNGGVGGGKLRAIDRCRAALAVERGEVAWWFRVLRLADPSAIEENYRHGEEGEGHVWDVKGIMSDLRVTRGRALFAALRAAAAADRDDEQHAASVADDARLDEDVYCHGEDQAVHRMRQCQQQRYDYLLGDVEHRQRILARELPHLSDVLVVR